MVAGLASGCPASAAGFVPGEPAAEPAFAPAVWVAPLLALVLALELSDDAGRAAASLMESVCTAAPRAGLAGRRLAVSMERDTCSVAQPLLKRTAAAHRPLASAGIFVRPFRL